MKDLDKKPDRVPITFKEINKIRELARLKAQSSLKTIPLTLIDLKILANELISENNLLEEYSDWVLVNISNAFWTDTFAQIPYSRRVLLLPQCIKNTSVCTAKVDELGLMCEACGACDIDVIFNKAEELGYLTIVAEGTTIVTNLFETGQIDGVLGVSCLNSLEKIFEVWVNNTVPVIGIPLLNDGCINTKVYSKWVLDEMEKLNPIVSDLPLNINTIKLELDEIFNQNYITEQLQIEGTFTEKLALNWLLSGGNRWRPLLTLGCYRAISISENSDEAIFKLALAIECFHKASLVHDDIEDNGANRYNEPSIHLKSGIPIALNIGDLLIGYGYHLLTSLKIENSTKNKLVALFSKANIDLTLGQGEELHLQDVPPEITVNKLIWIIQKKTVPAFKIALLAAALLCESEDEILQNLDKISEYIGIAYQIKDDILDFDKDATHFEKVNIVVAFYFEEILKSGAESVDFEINFQSIEIQQSKRKASLIFHQNKSLALLELQKIKSFKLRSFLFSLINKLLDNKQLDEYQS